MLEHYKAFHPKPKSTDGLKKILQLILDLPPGLNQRGYTAAVQLHEKTSNMCEGGGHFERVL